MSISAITPDQATKDLDHRDLLVLRINVSIFEQLAISNKKEVFPVEVNNDDALYVIQAFRNAGWICTVLKSQHKSKILFTISQ